MVEWVQFSLRAWDRPPGEHVLDAALEKLLKAAEGNRKDPPR